eukprot:8980702-Lingulodinium_polyedra.AAC.1
MIVIKRTELCSARIAVALVAAAQTTHARYNAASPIASSESRNKLGCIAGPNATKTSATDTANCC